MIKIPDGPAIETLLREAFSRGNLDVALPLIEFANIHALSLWQDDVPETLLKTAISSGSPRLLEPLFKKTVQIIPDGSSLLIRAGIELLTSAPPRGDRKSNV